MEHDNIDVIGNTPVTIAASAGDWEEVAKLLAAGADVRSCNCFGQNALYFALADGQFDLAFALFDAGARLDELAVGEDGRSALAAAAELRRTGRDVFAPLDKNIAGLCRNGSYEEAGKHIETATPAECSEALAELVRNGKYRPEVNLVLAEQLFARGGRIDPGLVQKYAVLKPDQLRNPVTYTAKMRQLIRKYQNK